MAKKEEDGNGYVKKNTLLVVALIALGVGFLGGVVFSSFKLGEKAPASAPAPPQAQVETQASKEDLEAKIRAAEKEAADSPNSPELQIKLGDLYFAADRYKDAIDVYKRSLDLSGYNADTWTKLGIMYRRDGDPKKAIEAFDRAIYFNPRHEPSRFNKGLVLMHDMHDVKGALEAWEGLLDIDPDAKAPNGQSVREMVDKLKASMSK